ncbi:hypothetical protein [Burkholderia territorii]|uniref:hypothetical protein n=1 Tax=Burkholderia territorii TaxID=1503055 RepID=UPI0009BE9B42|nr:hypothetical protein [Burkholderia territorii]
MTDAARSVVAKLTNNTKFVLTLDKSSIQLNRGKWITSPPDQISPGDVGQWESDSDKIAQGTDGSLRYQFVDQGTVNVDVYWSDPYNGENYYSIRCDSGGFNVGHSGGGGSNATVDYHIDQG